MAAPAQWQGQPMPVPPGYALQPIQPFPGRLTRPQPAAATTTPPSMALLYVWILLFGFVGTQLAWTLRPFFGDPDRPFALFRKIEGTFYMDVIRTIGDLLTG